jgi:hypothetical protein
MGSERLEVHDGGAAGWRETHHGAATAVPQREAGGSIGPR